MLNSDADSSAAKSRAGPKDDQKVEIENTTNKRKEEEEQQKQAARAMLLLGADQAQKASDTRIESGAYSRRPPYMNQNAGTIRTYIQRDHNTGASSADVTIGTGSMRGTGEQKYKYNHNSNATANRSDSQNWRSEMTDSSNQQV